MRLGRRQFLKNAAALLPLAGSWHRAVGAEGFSLDVSRDIIPAPSDPAQWPAFRDALRQWRDAARSQLRYNDELYRRREFAWAAANYSCCFVMMCDGNFYDRSTGKYTVEKFLNHGAREFGGYDSVVLWHAYPRIGFDQRNQFDFYRDQPGGLKGLRSVVRNFHKHHVQVYIDYNPWDTGTRRENEPDAGAVATLVRQIEADGVFLDTLNKSGANFRNRLDAARPGVILESEGAVPLENICEQHASWAQWFDDSATPGVLKQKWFEPRHMQHQIRRWDTGHTGELHTAWMNGGGMMVWENVFGSAVPWNERDRSILRAMLPIQRRYTHLFQAANWTPLVPTEVADVYASMWEGSGIHLWTLVNRAESVRAGMFLNAPTRAGYRNFDLIAGEEMSFTGARSIPPRGIACFVSGSKSSLGQNFEKFLKSQAALELRRNFKTETPIIKTGKIEAPRANHSSLPIGMVAIPATTLELSIDMRVRECGFYESTPPAEGLGDCYNFHIRTFRRRVNFPRFAIGETPVTNAQYAGFLRASGYTPRQSENFLKHWHRGAPTADQEQHPVVYVDLEDARAYAKWAGQRLPTEEEWQYAAQGSDGRKFPWGNEMEPGRCNDGSTGATTPVKQFPQGRSPHGCHDICGNVWEWTESERDDGDTRFCILRGGAFFQAKGSGWYADGGPQPANFAAKFLLAWPGLDRCSTIGFRCAADLSNVI